MPSSLVSWILCAAALLAAQGCGEDKPPVEKGAADPSAPVSDAAPDAGPARPATAAPGVEADGSIVSAVTWFHGTFDQALAEAKAKNKLVFVDVGAYWCPPCHKLDEEVFTQAAVGEFLGNGYVAVHIDAEKGEGPELVERYKVQAYPTMLVLEASGVEKGRLVDFLEPEALRGALGRIAAGGNVLADLEADAEAAPDDLDKQVALGHAYALSARREDALRVFNAVLVADPKNELGFAAKVLFDRALFVTAKLDKQPDAAVAEFRQLQARFPDSKQAVSAYSKIGRMLNRQGQPDAAIEALDAMLATDPKDAGLHASYGWFSFRQHCRPARGLEVVRAGLVLDPESADLNYLSAELHLATGDASGALAAMERASELEPDSAYYKRQVRRFAAQVPK